MKTCFHKSVAVLACLVALAMLTAQAQIKIKDIRPGAGSSNPAELVTINGMVYFVADDGVHGKELWKSNGTEAGTMMVKDIMPGSADAQIQHLTNVNGTLFFSATHPDIAAQNATKLWKSDGTEGGTVDLYDGHKPLESKNPEQLTNVGGTLYYTNTLALGGQGYWGLLKSTGGNSPGTGLIMLFSDEFPTRTAPPSDFTDVDGTLFFIYKQALYKSNGTAAGTIKVKNEGCVGPLRNINGTLFFGAKSVRSGEAPQLWKLASTPNSVPEELYAGVANTSELPEVKNLIAVNGIAYYSSTRPYGGQSYWALVKSDGTPLPGTGIFGTFIASSNDSPQGGINIPYPAGAYTASPTGFTEVNGALYFTFAGILWKSNGTAAGTVPVTNAPSPSQLTNVNGTLYFVSASCSIYKTDPSTTTASSVFSSTDQTTRLTNVNGTLFFVHSDMATGAELYKVGLAPNPPVLGLCQETESASGTGSTLSAGSASGGQYQSCFGNNSEYALYTVSTPLAGTYLLRLQAGSGENPTAGVQVNGGAMQPLPIGNTGGGASFAERTMTVNLTAGTNTIRIQGGPGGCFSQDKICLESQIPVVTFCQETELASSTGSTLSAGSASGGQYQSCFGNSGEYALYTVSAPSTGTYLLRLQAGSGENPTAGVQVNGGAMQPLPIGNTGGTTSFTERTLTINLTAGTNTIRIQGGPGGCFSQDKICLESQPNSWARLAAHESDESKTGLQLTVYPNPTTGKFQARFYAAASELVQMRVLDQRGHSVYEQKLVGEGRFYDETINVPSESENLLIFHLRVGDRSESRKILIK